MVMVAHLYFECNLFSKNLTESISSLQIFNRYKIVMILFCHDYDVMKICYHDNPNLLSVLTNLNYLYSYPYSEREGLNRQ